MISKETERMRVDAKLDRRETKKEVRYTSDTTSDEQAYN